MNLFLTFLNASNLLRIRVYTFDLWLLLPSSARTVDILVSPADSILLDSHLIVFLDLWELKAVHGHIRQCNCVLFAIISRWFLLWSLNILHFLILLMWLELYLNLSYLLQHLRNRESSGSQCKLIFIKRQIVSALKV